MITARTRPFAPKPRLPLTWLVQALSVQRSRTHLGRLEDRLLDDIGLTRAQADREAQAPAWNAPDHWTR